MGQQPAAAEPAERCEAQEQVDEAVLPRQEDDWQLLDVDE